jgi:magnesium chelatase family protein
LHRLCIQLAITHTRHYPNNNNRGTEALSLAIVLSRAQQAINAPAVNVKVHLVNRPPALHIVGLPETAAKESKDRVHAALLNARFEFPMRCITVGLAPAELPKEGGRFYLPIALGILAASGQIPTRGLESYEFVGELGLNGELRPIRGACPWRCRRRSQRTRSSCRVAMPMRPRSFTTVSF